MTNKIRKGTTFAVLALATAMAGAQDISVKVDGKPVNFSNASPRTVDGRVLVPLRGVFEEMGATVQWRAARREVIATRGDQKVTLPIGSRTATIDGREVQLDVPAMIVDGATMVPIRFVSESLGAEVHWLSAQQLVDIDTNGSRAQRIDQDRDRWQNRNDRNDRDDRNSRNDRTEVLQDNTIIPVSLDETLASNEARKGDTFTATVRRTGNDYYSMLPAGTKIEGAVVAARAQRGNEPGILELDFRRIIMPNGRSYNIDGRLVSLDAKGISKENDGRLEATGGEAKDNRTVYAGYGAGAGLLIGLLTKKPLEGTIAGGILGYLGGQVQKDQNKPRNVRLEPGTKFGVRLTQDVAINARDLRQ